MNKTYLKHYGVKGQQWGVRRETDISTNKKSKYRTDVDSGNKRNNIAKSLGIAAGGAAIGASVIGAAWYLKNRSNLKALKIKRAAATDKARATRAARKASGYYKEFKNVDVMISKGSDFIGKYMNVKSAKFILS